MKTTISLVVITALIAVGVKLGVIEVQHKNGVTTARVNWNK